VLSSGAPPAVTYTALPFADTATEAEYNLHGNSLHVVHFIWYCPLCMASESEGDSYGRE